MSTRATIRITQDERYIRLYHHHDGYPKGVGATLDEYLASLRGYWNMEEIANDLVKNNGINDDGFEITSSIHGDEDFFYWIDCDNNKLHCYKIGINEQEEDIVKPENEVGI